MKKSGFFNAHWGDYPQGAICDNFPWRIYIYIYHLPPYKNRGVNPKIGVVFTPKMDGF